MSGELFAEGLFPWAAQYVSREVGHLRCSVKLDASTRSLIETSNEFTIGDKVYQLSNDRFDEVILQRILALIHVA